MTRRSNVTAWGPLLGVLMAVICSTHASAQTFLSQDEALRVAFPGRAVVERKTAYLTDAQLTAARALAGRNVPVEQAIVTYYEGRVDGRLVGTAYFDAHRVRTLPEVLMVVVNPDHSIRQIEVLKFSEPPEYMAPGGWLDQFDGRRLDASLSTKGAIPNMTGATLTARAVTDAARRVLALHRIINPPAP